MKSSLKVPSPLVTAPFPVPTILSSLAKEGGRSGVIDLGRCENCRASQRVLARLRNIEPRWLFDHFQSQDPVLREKLATLHGVPVEQVLLVSGGMNGIRYSFEALTRPGTRVALLRPDFPFWHFAQRAQSNVSWLENPPTTEPTAFSNETIVEFAKDNSTEFFLLSNPSGATGKRRRAEEIAFLAESCPEVFFGIDESDDVGVDSAAYLTKSLSNIVVIRSFSKFYGLSGLRIGYIVVPPTLSETFRNIIDPLELTGMAIVAATEVLDDFAFQEETLSRVRKNLRTLEESCRGTRIKILPGSWRCFACYIWADSGEDPYATLARKGVLLAPSSQFGLRWGGRANLSDTSLIEAAASVIRQIE